MSNMVRDGHERGFARAVVERLAAVQAASVGGKWAVGAVSLQ